MPGLSLRTIHCTAILIAAGFPCRMAFATNYFRANPGSGSFTNAAQWTPHLAPLLMGPGDADDVVSFNLGAAPASRYALTGVTGTNGRLRVGNDALSLSIGTYTLVDPSTTAPSLSLGLANGDVADLELAGTSSDSLLQTKTVGMAFVAGSSATLSVKHLTWLSKGYAIIGDAATAALGISQEAKVIHTGSSWIGLNGLASGKVNVTGSGSQWTTTSQLIIGAHGQGELSISDGGSVVSTFGEIGLELAGKGNVVVTGANSAWVNSSGLAVGNHGKASLSILSGGFVGNGSAAVGVYPTSDGFVAISSGGHWSTNGSLSIGGGFPGTGETSGKGKVRILSGGAATVTGPTTVHANGSLNLENGSFVTPTIDVQGGQFNWTGGYLQVGLFQGNLTNQGGTLAPGGAAFGSTTVNGTYSQFSAGSLEFDLGGLSSGSSHDLVGITGSAILGGQLGLKLVNGFLPTPSDTLTIFNAAGGLFGVFNNVASGQRLSTLDGAGSFMVNYGIGSEYNQNQIVLSNFQPALAADFDHDGDVDAADLTVWKNATGLNDHADADGDHDSDGADFLIWQRQLGSVSAALGAVGAVPEPTSLGVASTSVLALLAWGRAKFLATTKRRLNSAAFVEATYRREKRSPVS